MSKKLGNSEHLQTSPTIPKSPLAAIFALQKRLSLKNSLKDQYLLHPSDEVLLTGKSTLTGGPEKHLVSPLVDIDHRDTSSVIVDVASTSTRTSTRISSLADLAHSPVSKSDELQCSRNYQSLAEVAHLLQCSRNFLRVPDESLSGDLASVDISTEENMMNLIHVGKNLLKKPVRRFNRFTQLYEEVIDAGTNEEALFRFAKVLSKERRHRQTNGM